MSMSQSDLDDLVKAAAEQISEHDIALHRTECGPLDDACAWNMNRRLNMIAYEDQQ